MTSKEETIKERLQLEERRNTLKNEIKIIEDEAFRLMKLLEEAQQVELSKKKDLDKKNKESQNKMLEKNALEKSLVDLRNQENEFQNNILPKKRSKINDLESALNNQIQIYENLNKVKIIENNSDDMYTVLDENKKSSIAMDVEESGQFQASSLLLDVEQMDLLDFDLLRVEVVNLDKEVKVLKKSVNVSAINDFIQCKKEYDEDAKELETATHERDQVRELLEKLRKKRLNKFMAGFSQITLNLKEMYQMITLGGSAELELVDSCDPFSEGIVFSVRPPKKSWKNISNLSGGEKLSVRWHLYLLCMNIVHLHFM